MGQSVSIVPLGGLGEIGKNMWIIEMHGEILVLDAGMMIPGDELPGVDVVIPDFSYLVQNKERVRGIVLTHGHEDHIGALPFILKEMNVPIYGTRLTLGFVRSKLQEHGLLSKAKLKEIVAGTRFRVGKFRIEPIHSNHSIPDAVILSVETPQGAIVYATDFKIDLTPIDGAPLDLHKLATIAEKGILVLMSDSTNAEKPGFTPSERTVGHTLMEAFREAEGRIFLATFASNVHRLQQAVDAAAAFGRRVCATGRSMVHALRVSRELGYLKVPDGLLIEVDEIDDYADHEVLILTTGSQGEPMSALSRMASGEHRQVELRPGDTVILSATPIPGNERLVARTIDDLLRLGVTVHHHGVPGLHVSGHASQEELKLMLSICRPRYFIPIHGEYRMLVQHARLAQELGVPADNVFIMDIGDTLEIEDGVARLGAKVPSGNVLVDGLGVGDVGNIVLRDRRQLAEDGILVAVVTIDRRTGKLLAGPDLVSRGFVYVRESEQLMEETKLRVAESLAKLLHNGQATPSWNTIKGEIRDTVSRYLYEKTRRRPMILPIVMEV